MGPYTPSSTNISGADALLNDLNTGQNKYAALLKASEIANNLF